MSLDRDHLRKGEVEIGREFADALAAETRHRAEEHDSSPLADVVYDPLRRRPDLLRFTPSAIDEDLERFVSRNATPDAAEAAAVRDRLTLDDFYTLIEFARRAALRALRTRDPTVAESGIRALSLIDSERIDWRDAMVAANLLSYALLRTGVDPSLPPRTATSIADAKIAAILRHITDHPASNLADWGYRELQQPAGAVLVATERQPYNPSVDLLIIALRIADIIDADVWAVSEVNIGSDLPAVWLARGDHDAVLAAISSVVACIRITASLRTKSENAWAQHLIGFLTDATAPVAASTIADSVGLSGSDNVATLGVHAGRLCCLLVSRSFVLGKDSFERGHSLCRFQTALEAALCQPTS